MFYEVIIPAAGQGKRMKAGKNKLFSNYRWITYHYLYTYEFLKKIELQGNHFSD